MRIGGLTFFERFIVTTTKNKRVMKKLLLTIVSVVAVTLSAQAQLSFGGKGRLSLTNVIG